MHNRTGRRKRLLVLAAFGAVCTGSMSAYAGKLTTADTTATWVSEKSGNWTDTKRWSSHPHYPNNGIPVGRNYQAVINATGGIPYTATINSNITVDGITIGSPDAQIDQTAGILQAPTIAVDSGTFQMDGGTISSTTLGISGGAFNIGAGTFNNVHVASGNLSLTNYNGHTGSSGRLIIENGLTFAAGSQINMSCDGDGPALVFDGGSQTADSINIDALPQTLMSVAGHGAVLVGGPETTGSATFTLGPQFLLHGLISIADGSTTGCTVINNGTITSDYNASPIFGGSFVGQDNNSHILVDNFVNNATVQATNGATLTLKSPQWTNAGTISASDGATVILASNFTNSGTFSADSTSSIEITGTLSNTGAIFTLPTAGFITLYGGTIIGGTINDNTNELNINAGTLNATTITGGNVAVSQTLTIQNSFTLDPGKTLSLLPNSLGNPLALLPRPSLITDSQSITLDNMVITGNPHPVGGSSIAVGGTDSGPTATLVLGANAMVQGALSIVDGQTASFPFQQKIQATLINNGTINNEGTNLQLVTDTLVNNGTLEAAAGEIEISSRSFTNTGSLIATTGNTGQLFQPTAGGFIDLTSNLTTAQLGDFSVDANSSMTFAGALDNTASTLHLPATGAILLTGSITGGVVDESAGNTLYASNATLDAVHVAGGNLVVGTPPRSGVIFGATGTIGQRPTEIGLVVDEGITTDPGFQVVLSASFLIPSLTFDGSDQVLNQATIKGNGNGNGDGFIYPTYIAIGGVNSVTSPTLTLGPNTTIHGALNIIDGGNSHTQLQTTLINSGTILADQSGGDLTISISNFINNGLLEATNGATLQIAAASFVNHGTFSLNGGTVSVLQAGTTTPGTLDVGDGTLAGNGAIDADLLLHSDPSTLAFQLRGESDYDQLNVNGNAILAGDLQITLAAGFQPSPTDFFTVLIVATGDSMTGQFLNVPDGGRLGTTDGAGSFLVNYGAGAYAGDIVLSDFTPALPSGLSLGTVPEPTSAVALGVTLFPLLGRRRRRVAR
jgi:hypothetical protein